LGEFTHPPKENAAPQGYGAVRQSMLWAWGGVYEPDEAERVSCALLREANRRYHTAKASSTGTISRAMGKPLGTGQLKGWIQQSGQLVWHS